MCCSTVTNLLASWEVKQTTAPAANVYCKDVGQSWRRVPCLWKKGSHTTWKQLSSRVESALCLSGCSHFPRARPCTHIPCACSRRSRCCWGQTLRVCPAGAPLPMAGDSGAGPGSSRPGQGSGEGGRRRPVLSALMELWAAPGSQVAWVLQPRSPEKPSLHPPNLNSPQQPPRSSLESLPILVDWEDI